MNLCIFRIGYPGTTNSQKGEITWIAVTVVNGVTEQKRCSPPQIPVVYSDDAAGFRNAIANLWPEPRIDELSNRSFSPLFL